MAKRKSDDTGVRETIIDGGPMHTDRIRRSIPIIPENRQAIDDFVADHNQEWSRFVDIDGRLAEVENELKAIIAAGGRSETDKRRLRDAREGLDELLMIRAYRSQGEVGAEKSALVNLGIILGRVGVRRFEIAVELGQKNQAGRERANRARCGTPEFNEKLNTAIVDAVNAMVEQGKKPGEACAILARREVFHDAKGNSLSAEAIRKRYKINK